MTASQQAPGAIDVARDHRLSANECQAIQYLHADGYTTSDLALALERTESTICDHLDGECGHPDLTSPLPPGRPSPEQIQAYRIQENLSQAELADRLDVATSTLSAWERGTREPRPPIASRLLAELRGVLR